VSGVLEILDRISGANEDRLGASTRATTGVEKKVMPTWTLSGSPPCSFQHVL
jgi:hypothetical protein